LQVENKRNFSCSIGKFSRAFAEWELIKHELHRLEEKTGKLSIFTNGTINKTKYLNGIVESLILTNTLGTQFKVDNSFNC
jgi:hypothetical protein